MKLHNFVLDQIKKHLALYNFSEIKTREPNTPELEFATTEAATHEAPKLLKVYAYAQELDHINIKILNTNNTEQDAYFIKMLDVFFMEKLKLENYALKINPSDSQECSLDCIELTKLLQILSVSYIVDPNLKTMFEFVSRDLGIQRTFVAGEYCIAYSKNNMQNIQNIKATINISKLITLVEKYQNRLLIPENPTLHIVIPVNKEQKKLALLLADKLQSNSLSADVILEDISISDMMAKANKLGAKYVLIVGKDEQRDGTVTVKNMQRGESISVKQSEIISYLK